MSFYSYRQGSGDICPGRIGGDCTRGLTERVCIQVKKVYDSCIQQQQLDGVSVRITDICPCGVKFDAPITFVSCRSTTTRGKIRDLCTRWMDGGCAGWGTILRLGVDRG